MDENTILEVQDLYVHFKQVSGNVYAVNGVDFDIKKGETVGIVGESGCGKSVTALSIPRLVPTPPAVIEGGAIRVRTGDGVIDAAALSANSQELRKIRGTEVAVIFQEPMRSLHPMFRVGDQIAEGLVIQKGIGKKEAREKAEELLHEVGIPDARRVAGEPPQLLSGGMRQRALIALALACEPNLLIADEPTTALDVTIQAQILELITSLQAKIGTSVLLITHDLGVIAETVERVLVMYLGQIIEEAAVEGIFRRPAHPYTLGLLRSVPTLVDNRQSLEPIPGAVPELREKPIRCVFKDRCLRCSPKCDCGVPPLFEVESGHKVRCWLYER